MAIMWIIQSIDTMKQGLISVILPIWKPNFPQLKQCIDSLINQTYGHQEIIIIPSI